MTAWREGLGMGDAFCRASDGWNGGAEPLDLLDEVRDKPQPSVIQSETINVDVFLCSQVFSRDKLFREADILAPNSYSRTSELPEVFQHASGYRKNFMTPSLHLHPFFTGGWHLPLLDAGCVMGKEK